MVEAVQNYMENMLSGWNVQSIPFSEVSGGLSLKLHELRPDMLVTVNLAGFELTTLCKGIFYNTLNCKSLHLLTERHLKNEYLLAKQLSISMFFYCQGEHYYTYLKNTYPDIPYLGLMKPMGVDKKNEYKMSFILEIFSQLNKETGLPLIP